ncbi:hypothetical protein YT1_2917 [Rhodococcus ruber]|nr:hypothetical protein YT1_2917 [Rhodococcus ruber]
MWDRLGHLGAQWLPISDELRTLEQLSCRSRRTDPPTPTGRE